jgi:iron complex outermembrane receptor protein
MNRLMIGVWALLQAVGVAAAADREELESVVVTATRATTATKTVTALTETPQAISVITADQFNDRGVLTMQETLRYSAGVTSEAYGLDTRQDQPVVRGFYSVQYLDGMMKLFGYSLIPRAEVYTLDRIEILRGPSSVLYGKGNTGGVTNMVSKRPKIESERELGVQFGSHDRKQLQFDLTGPIGDSFAARLVGVTRDSEMQTDQVKDDRVVLAPSLTWKAGDRTSITLLTLFQEDETASSQQFLPVVATLRAPPGRRLPDETFLGEPDFDKLDTRQSMASVLVEHGFSDALSLNSSWRYVNASTRFNEIYPDVYSNPEDPFIDADDRIVNRSAYSIDSDTEFFTTDNNVQYQFETGRFTHRMLAGIDYLDFREDSRSGSGDANSPIDIYAPAYGTFTAPELGPESTLRQDQIGVYLQDQVRYADRANFVLGVRRDRARSRVTGADEQTDYATTFRVGAIVDVGAGFSPYASYSESFLPLVGVDFYNQTFKPQEGNQYELGLKWQPRIGTLLTLAAFEIIETNRQTNDPNEVLNTVQTGEVRSKGMELEVSHAIARDLHLTAAYSYTQAEVTQSNFAPEVGRQVSDVPKDQASFWGVKTLNLNDALALRIGAGVRYVGETVSISGSGSLTTPSYTLADALASLEGRTWSFAVNATNLFDKQYYAPCRAFGDCFTGNRRVVFGTARYQF